MNTQSQKLYMFFPEGEKNNTTKDDIVFKTFHSLTYARKYAIGMIETSEDRYNQVTIHEVNKKDTIQKPFSLSNN